MRNFILCLLAILSLPSWMAAQGVSGKVVDEQQLPLPGVNVLAVGTTNATATDLDGNFTINVAPGTPLEFSMIGYSTQTSAAAAGMQVVLTVSATELNEVVVIGYGSANRRDLTGSIVKVDGREVADKPNVNPVASLQGKVAGLSVVNAGQPGQTPDIRIRGTISRYRTQPLYVIDGIFNTTMDYLNPNDIESIEVLKDPSSLAIFGVEGANGVIIVTTRKGKVGKTTINFNSSTGVKWIPNQPDLTNAEQFRSLYDQQRINQGLDPYPYYNLYNADTDWIDEIKQDSPIVSIHNISISSATEKNQVYFSAGYTHEDGLIRHELLKKFTFNFKDDLKVTDRFKVGAGISGYDARMPQLRDFRSALLAVPIVDAFNTAQGLYNQLPSELGGAQIGNPAAAVEMFKGTQINRDTRFVTNVYGEYELFDGLKFRAAYLADLFNYKGRGYTPVFDVFAAESNEATPYSGVTRTSVRQFKGDEQKIQQELLLTYDKTFGKHDFNAVAGYTRRENSLSSMNGSVSQFVDFEPIPNNPRFWYIDVSPFGDPNTRVVDSDEYSRSVVSLLARVLYNYDGKYLLNASFRRDASSQLNRWQSFWSVGAAWEVSKESFMQNQKIFDYLKIKGSLGELGNDYSAAIFYPTFPNYIYGASAVFGSAPGVPEAPQQSFVQAFVNNPNLRWEVVRAYEAGIEFESFDNRLRFEANYFHKTTKDLLNYDNLGGTGFFRNSGEILNKGFDFIASWRDNVGDFSYSLSGNLTTLSNKVLKTYGEGFEAFDGASVFSPGKPIGAFYGYEVEGVYQSYADILASPPSSLGAYDVGDLKFRDVNGDGVINGDDRTVIGNPTPDFTYGASVNFGYKGFSLSVDLQGVYGNEIYRDWGNGSSFAQFNYRSARLNAWNGPGTSNWEPRLNDASGYNTNNFSTYMIEDGSYVRLRNIQLGYDFSGNWLEKASLQALRLYVNAQNLKTWSNNSGFSPEAGGTPTRFGVDTGGYPVPAIVSLGINVTF